MIKKITILLIVSIPLFGFLQLNQTEEPVINILVTLDDAGVRDFEFYAQIYDSTSVHITPQFNAFAQSCAVMTKFATHEKCGPTRDRTRNPYPLYNTGREGVNLDKYDTRGASRKGASLAEIALQNNVFTAYLGKWHLGTFSNRTSMTYNYSHVFLGGVKEFYTLHIGVLPSDLRLNGKKDTTPYFGSKTILRQASVSSNTFIRTSLSTENREKTLTDSTLMILDKVAQAGVNAYIDINYTTGHTPNEFELQPILEALDDLYGLGLDISLYSKAQILVGIRKAQFEFWDQQFGRLWSKVQQLSAEGKKVNILFFSDNPASKHYVEYNSPLTLKKGQYGSSIFNIALFYSTYLPINTGPYNHLVSVNDVYPTMVDLMGIKKKVPNYGRSFVNAMQSGIQLHPNWEIVPLSVGLGSVQSVAVQVDTFVFQETTSTASTNQHSTASDSLVYNISTDYAWSQNLNLSPLGKRLHDSLTYYKNNAPQQEINTVPVPSWYDDVNYYIGEYPQNHSWD